MPDKPLKLELLTFYIIVPVKLGCLYFLLIKLVPVDILEPWIVFERGKGGTPKPGLWLIFIEQLIHQLLGLLILK